MESKTKKLLYEMLRIRRVQEAIANRYSEQEMRCPTHLCIGQEAVAVGIISAIENNDIVMSHHRAHGHYLAKGGDLTALIAEMYGKATGCSRGWGGSQHLVDLSVNFFGSASIIGGTVPIATGTAFANKYKNLNNISIVFFGDAVAEEGILHETMNFASINNLPIMFVCENNLYSVQTHISKRQPAREIYKIAQAHDIKSYQVDGNDVYKISELATNCIKDIRNKPKPVFIEALTYRFREHVGPEYDYDLGYRNKEEVDSWEEKCPIKRLKDKMEFEKNISLAFIENIEKQIQNEIKTAFNKALGAPFPNIEVFNNVK